MPIKQTDEQILAEMAQPEYSGMTLEQKTIAYRGKSLSVSLPFEAAAIAKSLTASEIGMLSQDERANMTLYAVSSISIDLSSPDGEALLNSCVPVHLRSKISALQNQQVPAFVPVTQGYLYNLGVRDG